MSQPAGIAGDSGNSISRIRQLFDFGQPAPSKADVLIVNRRRSSGDTKQPFQSPMRWALALSRRSRCGSPRAWSSPSPPTTADAPGACDSTAPLVAGDAVLLEEVRHALGERGDDPVLTSEHAREIELDPETFTPKSARPCCVSWKRLLDSRGAPCSGCSRCGGTYRRARARARRRRQCRSRGWAAQEWSRDYTVPGPGNQSLPDRDSSKLV